MNKTILFTKLKVVALIFVTFSQVALAQTNNCSSIMPWYAYNVYEQGNIVKHNGNIYQNQWWNQNNTPGDPAGPWALVQACTGDWTITDPVDCSQYNAWSSTVEYAAGNYVSYNGMLFKARNYSLNLVPGTVGNPWDAVGFCSSSNPPPSGGTTTTTVDWAITGNNNTTASSFLGTTNSQPVIFKANNSEVMRILPVGSVGIGTSSFNAPYHKFTVNGRTNLIGTENALTISSPNLTPNGSSHYIYFSHLTFASQPSIQYANIGAYEYNNGSPALQKGKHLILQAADSSRLGIGWFSSTPPSKFNVNGSSYFNGKVGIGTAYVPAAYSLAVNGKIIATEVAVKYRNHWPDYVFTSDYSLPSLDSVSSFIEQNKHLPGVPSAQEVSEHGVELGEMDAILLKKIEELTLYTLEQQKLIKEQAEANAKLMKMLEAQEQRLQELEKE